VAGALRAAGAGEPELITITTSGDRQSAAGGGTGRTPAGAAAIADDKSRFVREIDEALVSGEVDLAVHSAKDVPGELAAGVLIAAVPATEDPRDALCGATSLEVLPPGARIGTSSLRRRAQVLAVRPDLEVGPLHGNVDTRLRRLAEGSHDAVVLALAGLRRLHRAEEASALLDPDAFVPAPGQGALAIACRSEDRQARDAALLIESPPARARIEAERAVVEGLGASCHTPVGALARIAAGRGEVTCFAGLPDGSEWITDRVTGPATDPHALGERLAERMLAAGAGELLARAEAF
jgi:hydroxymethylbilane synthase